MHLNRENIGTVKPILIDIRDIGPHPFNQFILPHHSLQDVAFTLRCNKKLTNIVNLATICALAAGMQRARQFACQQKMHRNMVSAT
jgi:hypothetical protein